jgi:hypothetical protein
MIKRKCAICTTIIEVSSIKSNKIYCSKDCKYLADKNKFKLDYQNNPEKYKKKSITSYFKNHKENKEKAKLRAKLTRIKNPSQFKNSKLKQAYGISLDEFNVLLNNQNNCCAICTQPFSSKKMSEKPFVDHNHKTGKVRQLLCLNCNSIIGYSRENMLVLKAAIKYLKKFENSL